MPVVESVVAPLPAAPAAPPARPLLRIAQALALVAGWYAASRGLALWLGEAVPRRDIVPWDLAAYSLIALLLLGLARSFAHFAVATLVLFTSLLVGNALKLQILGSPLMPDDFLAARNLFMLLEGWQWWLAAALLGLPLLTLVMLVDWRRGRSAWLLIALLLGGLAFVRHAEEAQGALDRSFGDWVWNQRGNFEARGLPIHLLQETARNLVRRGDVPAVSDVASAFNTLDRLPPQSDIVPVSESSLPTRNVHVIVLESFWDPLKLGNIDFSADPLDPEFRKLWRQTGHSHALSPVFGGYTANSEFELLCGFPVTHDSVFFEGRLRRDVPCLPAHLASAGYATHASHPNSAAFWNRVNAYRRIGFEHYWSQKDFAADDMVREFLSDESLFRQVLARLGDDIDGPQPVFNYVLTYFGHLDYPLNATRPPVITASNGKAMAEAYANTVYYKSREVMAFIKELRARDPDGLIVMFGDHLPNLGPNFANYADAGLLATNRAEFDAEMFRTLTATPLIVIDGKRGPRKLGDVPIYQLPSLILDLLGDERGSILHLAAQDGTGARIRPLPGVHVSTRKGRAVALCTGNDTDAAGDTACADSQRRLAALDVLTRDIFSGAQHALSTDTLPLIVKTARAD